MKFILIAFLLLPQAISAEVEWLMGGTSVFPAPGAIIGVSSSAGNVYVSERVSTPSGNVIRVYRIGGDGSITLQQANIPAIYSSMLVLRGFILGFKGSQTDVLDLATASLIKTIHPGAGQMPFSGIEYGPAQVLLGNVGFYQASALNYRLHLLDLDTGQASPVPFSNKPNDFGCQPGAFSDFKVWTLWDVDKENNERIYFTDNTCYVAWAIDYSTSRVELFAGTPWSNTNGAFAPNQAVANQQISPRGLAVVGQDVYLSPNSTASGLQNYLLRVSRTGQVLQVLAAPSSDYLEYVAPYLYGARRTVGVWRMAVAAQNLSPTPTASFTPTRTRTPTATPTPSATPSPSRTPTPGQVDACALATQLRNMICGN